MHGILEQRKAVEIKRTPSRGWLLVGLADYRRRHTYQCDIIHQAKDGGSLRCCSDTTVEHV